MPIIEFKGRVIPWEEGAVMLLRGANHVITFDAKHDMDARPQWSPAGHVNHGCYPNCAIKKKRGGLWLTSIRPIEQGEELLIDYDFDLGEEFEPCRCGHPRCRGLMLRRKDWPKLRKLMSKVAARSRNQRSVRTILLAAAALAVLTGCQSAGEKQRLQAEAQSGDLANCARIRVASSGCGRNSGFTEVYVDNMHKDHAVRATVRKHSPEGDDDDTEYAIAEGGQLLVGCGGGDTSFAVVRCEVLKGEAEKR